jgi:hypothetical protein
VDHLSFLPHGPSEFSSSRWGILSEVTTVNDEDIARLSPARYEHLNPYGKCRFEIEEGLSRTRLRPLRLPTEHQSL